MRLALRRGLCICAVWLFGGLISGSGLRLIQAQGIPEQKDTHPVEVGLLSLNGHLHLIAGHNIRLRGVSIAERLDGRTFVVEDGSRFDGPNWALLLVGTEAPLLRPGAPVTLTGQVVTFYGASLSPGAGELLQSPELADRFADAPVILVDRVTTPEGVVLYPR